MELSSTGSKKFLKNATCIPTSEVQNLKETFFAFVNYLSMPLRKQVTFN